MKRSALLVALLCTGSVGGRCQEPPNFVTEPRETMRGLLGVNVATEHNGCGGIVDKALVKQDIEVRLRIAGIRILELPFVSLEMMANCPPLELGGKRQATIIEFTLSLKQIVWIPPQPVRVTMAATWESGEILMCGVNNKCDEMFRSHLKNHVDKFVNDYLAVNPKL